MTPEHAQAVAYQIATYTAVAGWKEAIAKLPENHRGPVRDVLVRMHKIIQDDAKLAKSKAG